MLLSAQFRTKSDHHVDLRTDHFRRRSERLGCPLVDPSVFNDEIPALGESELAQFSKKLGIAPHKKGLSGAGPRNPIRWICPVCCARAASGHAEAPPISAMNSRRLVCRESSILRGD